MRLAILLVAAHERVRRAESAEASEAVVEAGGTVRHATTAAAPRRSSTETPSKSVQEDGSEAACPRGQYCNGRIDRSILFWKDDQCIGTCTPCYTDPDGSWNGQTCATCVAHAGLPSCTSCGYGLPDELLPRASELYALLKDRGGRMRCYPRARDTSTELPGLCKAAPQGREGIEALSLGQVWGVWNEEEEAYHDVPVRLQPYRGRALAGAPPPDPDTLKLYVALYPETSSVWEEMAATVAGTAMGAQHLFYFEITRSTSVVGTELAPLAEAVPEASESLPRVASDAVLNHAFLADQLFELDEVTESGNSRSPLEAHVTFDVQLIDMNRDEVATEVPYLRLSQAAVIDLGTCLDFLQTGALQQSGPKDPGPRGAEALDVMQQWLARDRE